MHTRCVFAASLALAALFAGPCPAQEVVTIYSADGLHDGTPTWYQTQFDAFTKATGIKVQYIEAGSGGVVERVAKEATNPQADVLVTLPPFIMKAVADSLIQAYTPTGADQISDTLKDKGGMYVALSNNYMNFIYNASVIKEARLLVAFSRPPLLLNGTVAIVFIAHFVLISAFTYGNVSAGLARLSPDFEQVAESLGARPAFRLLHVTLPLILPQLIAAVSLSFALSMGELGATVMVYPPGWVTTPVGIFALTDRGEVFDGAASTMLLILATLVVLIVLSRIPTKAAAR
jgi:ABC-type proline/glycine betaine transport system permease subunit